MEKQAYHLGMVDILRPLIASEIDELVRRSAGARLEAGETFDIAEDTRILILLVSGRVRVFEPNHSGQEITLSVAEGGTVLAQTGFTLRRVTRVEALERSVVRWGGKTSRTSRCATPRWAC